MSRFSSLAHLVGAIALILTATGCSEARAQEWQKLSDKTQVVTLEGQPVTIVVRTEVRFSDGQSGGIDMSAKARASLDDLQAKGPDILRALASHKSSCDTRWSFPQVLPATVQGGKLKIEGQAHAEQWLCSGPLKTRLIEATADFTVALQPARRETEIGMSAEIERFEVHGALSGLSGDLKQLLSSSLSRLVEGDAMKFKFPPEVANVNPRFTDAHLVDAGEGKGELHVEATAVIRAADMARILSLIAK